MKAFREKLEDSRVRLEDCSRCFSLLESCKDNLEEDTIETQDFIQLAERCGNEKLLHKCKVS